ncbi:MAG: DUF3786 domain-containing protein [Candidatus Omnitrophota bacterium]
MDLNPALKIAVADFKKTDFSSITFRSGADFTGEEVQVCYLNRKYSIRLPEVAWQDEISLREKIIILHYLTRSKGTPLSGKAIDFREVPGGNLYYPIFEARVHRPFLKTFASNPKLLDVGVGFIRPENAGLINQAPTGKMAGGTDISVIIPVFPKISIQFFLYPGDEELPSDCKVLFDANISDYLTTEDVVVVCEDTVKSLKNQGCHSCG